MTEKRYYGADAPHSAGPHPDPLSDTTPTPTPWELIEATEHHGAYIVNSWGRTICDLYAMSNPMAASVRNGGTSFPVHFDDMAANAAFIVKAVNAHDALVEYVRSSASAGCVTAAHLLRTFVDVSGAGAPDAS